MKQSSEHFPGVSCYFTNGVVCSVSFMLDLRKEKKEEYAVKVKKIASSLNLKVAIYMYIP